MSLTINMKPEAEAELMRLAVVHGLGVEAYAASLLEDAVHVGASPNKVSTAVQLDRTLRELARFSSKIPPLPDEAFSRESLYRDHD